MKQVLAFSGFGGGTLLLRAGALAPPRSVSARFPWLASARPRLRLPGPAIAMARPRTWPGPPGAASLRCVSGRAADSVSRRAAVCSRFAAPAALVRPGSGSQVRPPRRPDPGPPPARPSPSCSKTVSGALSLLAGPKGRSSAPRPDYRACVRAQTGVTYTTGPEIRGSRFRFSRAEVLGRRRFARSLPSAPALRV